MLRRIAKVFCLVITLGLAASPAFAQARSSSADITGVVRDSGKSVVRGATVKATNMATGLTRIAITDTNGAYRIPLLPPGVYEVKIEVKGFNTQIKKDITLTVGQVMTLNFDLAVGGPKVIVETAVPLSRLSVRTSLRPSLRGRSIDCRSTGATFSTSPG